MVGFIQRRLRTDESGFTLIELLVVMIIIAILLAVAIPLFLGQKQRAVGTAAKATNRLILGAIESCVADPNNATCTAMSTITFEEDALITNMVPTATPVCAPAKTCGWVGQFAAPTTVAADNDTFTIFTVTSVNSGIRIRYEYSSSLIPHRTCRAVSATAPQTTVTPTAGAQAKFAARACTPPNGNNDQW